MENSINIFRPENYKSEVGQNPHKSQVYGTLAGIAENQAELSREVLAANKNALIQQGATNALISSVGNDIAQLERGLSQFKSEVSTVLKSGFNQVFNLLSASNDNLEAIKSALLSPYETQTRELRKRAEKLYFHGMEHQEYRNDSWLDALDLFDNAISKPIGKQDFIAHYYMGCLYRDFKQDLPAAIASFSHAERLASMDKNDFYAQSLLALVDIYKQTAEYGIAYKKVKKLIEFRPEDLMLQQEAAICGSLAKDQEFTFNAINACLTIDSSIYSFLITNKCIADFEPAVTYLIDLYNEKTAKRDMLQQQMVELIEHAQIGCVPARFTHMPDIKDDVNGDYSYHDLVSDVLNLDRAKETLIREARIFLSNKKERLAGTRKKLKRRINEWEEMNGGVENKLEDLLFEQESIQQEIDETMSLKPYPIKSLTGSFFVLTLIFLAAPSFSRGPYLSICFILWVLLIALMLTVWVKQKGRGDKLVRLKQNKQKIEAKITANNETTKAQYKEQTSLTNQLKEVEQNLENKTKCLEKFNAVS